MVQEQKLTLYGFSLKDFEDFLILDEKSPSGLVWSKVFAVRKYGYETALSMAKCYRLNKESQNNTQARRGTLNADA